MDGHVSREALQASGARARITYTVIFIHLNCYLESHFSWKHSFLKVVLLTGCSVCKLFFHGLHFILCEKLIIKLLIIIDNNKMIIYVNSTFVREVLSRQGRITFYWSWHFLKKYSVKIFVFNYQLKGFSENADPW